MKTETTTAAPVAEHMEEARRLADLIQVKSQGRYAVHVWVSPLTSLPALQVRIKDLACAVVNVTFVRGTNGIVRARVGAKLFQLSSGPKIAECAIGDADHRINAARETIVAKAAEKTHHEVLVDAISEHGEIVGSCWATPTGFGVKAELRNEDELRQVVKTLSNIRRKRNLAGNR